MSRDDRAGADWSRMAAEVLGRLPAGVLVLHSRRRTLIANLRAAAVLGCPVSERVGRPLGEVLPELSEKLGSAGTPAPDGDRLRASFVRPDGRVASVGFRGGDAVADGRGVTALLFQDLTGIDALRRERDRLLQLATDGEVLPDVLARCRELFFTTKPDGSGIGPALCESVVSGAGGRMEVESAEERETLVRVQVPVTPPAPSVPDGTPRRTAGTP